MGEGSIQDHRYKAHACVVVDSLHILAIKISHAAFRNTEVQTRPSDRSCSTRQGQLPITQPTK